MTPATKHAFHNSPYNFDIKNYMTGDKFVSDWDRYDH